MTGTAYKRSAELAGSERSVRRLCPPTTRAHKRVMMRKHAAANDGGCSVGGPTDRLRVLHGPSKAWQECLGDRRPQRLAANAASPVCSPDRHDRIDDGCEHTGGRAGSALVKSEEARSVARR